MPPWTASRADAPRPARRWWPARAAATRAATPTSASGPATRRPGRWLAATLTAERLRELLPEAAGLPVTRYLLPNLRAVNFVIEGLLGEGVAAAARFDPQAKAVGEWLRVPLPRRARELCCRAALARSDRAAAPRSTTGPPTTPRTAAAMLAKLAEIAAEHAKAIAGGGPKYTDRHRGRGKLLVRERIELLLDPGHPVPGTVAAGGVGHRVRGRRQRRHRDRRGRGHRVRDLGQRPDRARRHQQPVDGAQDVPGARHRAGQPAAGHLAGRVRRRRPADAEGDLHPRRPDVPRPDPAVGGRHPDDRARLRQLHRRRRVRARHVRPRGDDLRPVQGVPRRAAAGQDGDRRGVRRRVARRRRDARADRPAWPTTWPPTSRTRSGSAAGSSPAELAQAGPGRRPRPARRRRCSTTSSCSASCRRTCGSRSTRAR